MGVCRLAIKSMAVETVDGSFMENKNIMNPIIIEMIPGFSITFFKVFFMFERPVSSKTPTVHCVRLKTIT